MFTREIDRSRTEPLEGMRENSSRSRRTSEFATVLAVFYDSRERKEGGKEKKRFLRTSPGRKKCARALGRLSLSLH